MDWTKAKNILIIALLMTNLILGGLYYYQYGGRDVAPETEIDATVALLADRGIHVETEIPDKIKRMPVLFVKYDRTDEDRVADVLEEQQEQQGQAAGSLSEQEIVMLCDEVIFDCGFTEDSLIYDSIRHQKEEVEVIYKNMYEGILLEESGIVCTVKEGIVTSLKRFWLSPVGYGDTKQKVIQANVALLQFMSEWVKEHKDVLQEEVTIEDIRLVYWLRSDSDSEGGVTEDTAVPAWRITYNGGAVSFIEAYDSN